MPRTSVRKLRGKYRVVEQGTRRIARTSSGKARDGGGHTSRGKAGRQAGYVNEGMQKEGH